MKKGQILTLRNMQALLSPSTQKEPKPPLTDQGGEAVMKRGKNEGDLSLC